MAITLVQGPLTASVGESPVSKAWNVAPTAGNLLLAGVRGISDVVANASIPGWTLAASSRVGASAWNGIFYKVAASTDASSDYTVALSWNSSTSNLLSIMEWSGLSSSTDVLDQIASTDYTSTVTSKTVGPTSATTIADELAVAVVSMGSTTSALSWSDSFTNRDMGLNNHYWATKVLAATGAVSTTASWTTARISGGCLATFKGSTILLVIANATEAQTVDNVTLTGHIPTWSLTVQNATQSQTVDNLTLTAYIPHADLTIQNATQAIASDNLTLTGHVPTYSLTVANATQSQTVDNLTLTGHIPTYSLTVQDATQSQTVENVWLRATVPTWSLTVANATQVQTVDNVTLTGHIPTWALTIANATQAITSDEITLTAHDPGAIALTVDNATQAQTADNVTLTGHIPTWTLTVADATQGITSDEITLTAHASPLLVIQDATQGIASDNVSLVWHPVPSPTPTGGVIPLRRLSGVNRYNDDELVLLLFATYMEERELEYAD